MSKGRAREKGEQERKESKRKVRETKPGKRTCKYYGVCGNAENCKRCESFERRKK